MHIDLYTHVQCTQVVVLTQLHSFPQEDIPQLRDVTNNPTESTHQNNGTGMYVVICPYNIFVQNYGYITVFIVWQKNTNNTSATEYARYR